MHRVGFEPTQLTLPGLKSGSLDHSDIDADSLKTFRSFLNFVRAPAITPITMDPPIQKVRFLLYE